MNPMNRPAPHSLFTLLRLWAEGLAQPELLLQRYGQLPGLDATERMLGLALLTAIARPGADSAAALAQVLSLEWLERNRPHWQTLPLLGQQLAIELAKGASRLHGTPEWAFRLYDACLLLLPDLAAARYYRGLLLLACQRWEQAAADLRRAGQLQPEWLPAWTEGARALLLAGQPEQALQLLAEAESLHGGQTDFWLVRGNLAQALGQLDQAESWYRRALALNPDQAGVWSNLGLVCQQLLRQHEAESCYQRALALDPTLAELWNNLASLQLERGELAGADQALGQCLQLLPGYYPAWVNRGLLAAAQQQTELAHSLLAQARTLEPGRPESWLEAARLYFGAGQADQALALLEAASERVQPAQRALVDMVLGRSLALRHDLKGPRLMQQATRLAPERRFWRFVQDVGVAEAWFCRPQPERKAYLAELEQRLIDWAENSFAPQVYLEELRHLPPETLWSLVYLDVGPFRRLKSQHASCFQLAAPRPAAGGRCGPLRLGVVVTSGHEGIFFKLAARQLAGLPPSCAEVLLLGDLAGLGPLARQLQLKCLQLAPGVTAAARQLRGLELDLIYYWEVGSDALNFLLPYFQPAPVQFTSWGTTATTGQAAIQYYLSAVGLEAAGAQAHYSEQLLLAEHLPVCFDDPLPATGGKSRTELGLPPEGTLYACLNNPLKLTPEFLGLAGELLAQDPSGHLLLLGSRLAWINEAVQAAARVLPQQIQARIHWLPAPLARADFLNILALADIGLDSLICSGGHVSHEALALGLPVITLPSETCHGRLTLGRYHQLGISELIAKDRAEYLRLAQKLATAPTQRAALRDRILERRERLLLQTQPVTELADQLQTIARNEGLRK